jgi:hypothetical protein
MPISGQNLSSAAGAGMKPAHQQRPIEVALPDYGVFVLESHHAPGFRMTVQCHDFLEIFYVLDGSGAFRLLVPNY